MEDSNREIIDREISGITFRNLIWFIGGIMTVVLTVITTYFSIIRKLDSYTNGINDIQNSVQIINTKVINNTEDIKNIQQHTIPSLDNRMSIMEERMKDKIFIKNVP
jgi:hypothetical protein